MSHDTDPDLKNPPMWAGLIPIAIFLIFVGIERWIFPPKPAPEPGPRKVEAKTPIGTTYSEALLLQVENAETVTIDWLSVAAGCAGAIAAAFRVKATSTAPVPASQWTSALIAGAGTAAFAGPYICDLLGMTSTRASLMVHFVTGILGSAAVDTVLANGKSIIEYVIGFFKKS